MSVGNKKKDRDNQGSSTSSGGEASANYMIGKAGEGGRRDTGGGEATTSKVTNSQEGITTQKEKATSASSSQQNQTPSEPVVRAYGPPVMPVRVNSVITPVGVILPIFLAPCSPNQTLPSLPGVTSLRLALAVGTTYSVLCPRGVTLAIVFVRFKATQRLPS